MTASLETFPLFYRQPIPLGAEHHGKARLMAGPDFTFAAGANSIPLVLSEFPNAIRHYPIVFSTGPTPEPIALLGLANRENLFVEPDPADTARMIWREDCYIPDYARRYPFILMATTSRDHFAVCVESGALAAESETAGEPLLADDGTASAILRRGVELCRLYQAAYQPTREWADALAGKKLLEERNARVELPDGQGLTLGGFQVVNLERLNDLPNKIFLEWRRRGWLAPIHLHLASASNWGGLITLYRRRLDGGAAQTI